MKRKKLKEQKKCIIKRRIKFEDYKDSLFNNNTILRSQLRFKCDLHIEYTLDDKRLQTFNRITTCPYGTNTFTVCESEMMTMKNYE